MLKTVKDACSLHDGTLEYHAAGGVENLFQTVNSEDHGAAFFQRNFVTRGMEDLLREGLLRLSGRTDQALFELAQAMGGGKTHLMSALGLLARYPDRRSEVLPDDVVKRIDTTPARVAVFDGRESPDEFLWGAIATQIGDHAESVIRRFWENGPKPPGKEHWKEAIGEDPTLILFDELPPYFREANTRTVGNGTLADVLTRAMGNLFAAALELPRCCIVLANLEHAYAHEIKDIHKLIKDVQAEADRHAKTITPVALDGSEIYSILRKRLFKELPNDGDIDDVSEAYADIVKRAEQGGFLKARSMEQVAEEVRQTYPFHPSFKHIVTLFKDNPDFRETRGLLQFAARVVRSVWNRKQNDVYLIGTQHLDLNDQMVQDEVTDINRSLRPAITKDIADQGNAHAEVIDDRFNTDGASQVATLLLSSSLSLSVRGHTGLRYEEVIEYLLAPNRKPDEFTQSFDELRQISWYLHREGDLFYFKDTENLTRRIQNEAAAMSEARVDQMLSQWLESALEPRSKIAYQKLLVMPKTKEILEEVPRQRILVVVKPDNSVPPEQMQRLYENIGEKNHLLILAGNDTRLAERVESSLRELYAVQDILKTIRDNETLRQEALQKKEDSEQSFLQALQSTFNRLFFPGGDGDLTSATLPQGLKFRTSDQQTAEQQIEELLASAHCDHKLVTDLENNAITYMSMAEQYLWPQGQRRVPWRDVVSRANTMPEWPWMPGSKGLDQLKRIALAEKRWRDTNDGYIEKGPFPKEKTQVSVVSQITDVSSGEAVLQLTTKNAGAEPQVHYGETSSVSPEDPIVQDIESFRTRNAILYFLAVDSSGTHETGEPEKWVARFDIKHQPRQKPLQREVELKVVPEAEIIRYTLDGTNPREGRWYDGPFEITDDKQVLQVFAKNGEAEGIQTFHIPAHQNGGETAGETRPDLDRTRPARLIPPEFVIVDDTEAVFKLMHSFSESNVVMHDARLLVGEAEATVQVFFGDRELTFSQLKQIIQSLRETLGEPDANVQLKIRNSMDFPTGEDLYTFASVVNLELTSDMVEPQ